MAKRSTYRPFGEISDWGVDPATAPETKGFVGERFDADAGLQYLNARYYDPELGRFIQPDWFEVIKAGVGTNRYAYSFNDPVNLRDPGGNSTIVFPDPKNEGEYFVEKVHDDDDLAIYVRNDDLPRDEWEKLGETHYWDSFRSPDTGRAVGKVYQGQSLDEY